MATRWTRKASQASANFRPKKSMFLLDTTDAFKNVGAREIKKVPALARKDVGQFLRRTEHTNPNIVRIAALRSERGRNNRLGYHFQPEQRRNAQRYGAQFSKRLHADLLVIAPQFRRSAAVARGTPEVSIMNQGDGAAGVRDSIFDLFRRFRAPNTR